MKTPSLLVVVMVFGMAVTHAGQTTNSPASPEVKQDGASQFLLAFGKVTIGGKEVDTAIQWNTKTGEARMLNAASFSDKSTGQEGNLVGWVPIVDLQQAIQNLATQIQNQQTNSPAAKTEKVQKTP